MVYLGEEHVSDSGAGGIGVGKARITGVGVQGEKVHEK